MTPKLRSSATKVFKRCSLVILLSSFSSRRISLGIMAWWPFRKGHLRRQQSNNHHRDPPKMRPKNMWSHLRQSPRPNLSGTLSISMPRSRINSRNLNQPLQTMCCLVKLRALAGRVLKRSPKSSPLRHPNPKHFRLNKTRSRLTKLFLRERRLLVRLISNSSSQGKSSWSSSLAKMRWRKICLMREIKPKIKVGTSSKRIGRGSAPRALMILIYTRPQSMRQR